MSFVLDTPFRQKKNGEHEPHRWQGATTASDIAVGHNRSSFVLEPRHTKKAVVAVHHLVQNASLLGGLIYSRGGAHGVFLRVVVYALYAGGWLTSSASSPTPPPSPSAATSSRGRGPPRPPPPRGRASSGTRSPRPT
ncbi:unnamed protein product [Ectocarpus sp. 12 AP-2014]